MKKYAPLFLLLVLLCWGCDQPAKKAKEKKVKKLEGLVQHHYSDGTLASEVTYKDKKKHGYAKGYFPSGKLQGEFNYEDDVLHGITKLYYENGNLYREIPYTRGQVDGIQKNYRQAGGLLAEVPYKDGDLGLGTKEYTKDGKLKTKLPEIKIEHINNLLKNNEYILRISLSERNSKAKFYAGELHEGKYLRVHKLNVLRMKNGVAEVNYNLPPGAYIMETVQFIAETETSTGTPQLITKKVNIAIENKGY